MFNLASKLIFIDIWTEVIGKLLLLQVCVFFSVKIANKAETVIFDRLLYVQENNRPRFNFAPFVLVVSGRI